MLKIGFLVPLFLFILFGASANTQLKLEVTVENEAKEHRFLVADGLWDSFEEVQMTEEGWSYVSLPTRVIEFWKVEIFTLEVKGSIKNRVLDLSTLEALDRTKIPAIHSLFIDVINFKGSVDIALHKWKQFPSWKYANNIYAFGVEASNYSDIRMNLNALRIFDLYTLRVPMQVGDVLDAFPNLGILHARGVLSSFTHQIYQLNWIEDLQEYDPVYTNAFETLHAERYYFFQCQNAQERMESPIYMFGYMDALFIETEDARNQLKDGSFVFYENDYPEFTGKTIDNDTLLHGYRKDGKHTGVHTFKIQESYTKNDREKFHIDFSNPSPPKFERDGHWQFNYVNGNVAIEGELRNRKKIGEWKFYQENGILRTVKTFDNDTLKRSITRFELHGDTCESRTYYLNPLECIQSFTNADGTKFQHQNFNEFGQSKIGIQPDYLTLLDPESNQPISISKRNELYDVLFRKHVVDLLFPEYIGKELPFTIE